MESKTENKMESKTTTENMFTSLVPAVPDFPKKGITFRNIAPLLRDAKARTTATELLAGHYLTTPIDTIVGIDARGFLFGVLLADKLEKPFVMARKPSKLPGKVETVAFDLEYASACLEIETDAIKPGQKVLIVDDILATGGSICAAAHLVQKMGATVTGVACLALIAGLGGVEKVQQKTNCTTHYLLECNNNDMTLVPSIPKSLPLPLGDEDAPFTLLWHPSMANLAETMYRRQPELFHLGAVKWDTFPDKSANIQFPDYLAGKKVVFLASMFEKATYIDQLSLMAVLPRQLIESLYIYLPYYAPGTMERIEKPGILATADTYAQITSKVFPMTKSGPPVLSVFDLHNSVTRHSFSNDVCFQPLSGIRQILAEMNMMCTRDLTSKVNWAIAFPDEGSYKRFRGLIPDYATSNIGMIICGKVRDGDKRVVRIMDTIPATLDIKTQDHVLIADDLVQTGGTLHECHLALKTAGAKRVSAYCTHAVFPQKEYMHFLTGGKWEGLENFWITDSIPKNAALLKGHEPFRIISLANAIITNLTTVLAPSFNTKNISLQMAGNNTHKMLAAVWAFKEAMPTATVSLDGCQKSESFVSEQPIGMVEIHRGAENRLNGIAFDKRTTHAIAIENGIYTDDKGDIWDVAVVTVRNRNGTTKSATTRPVPVDKKVYEAHLSAKAKGEVITCGEIYQNQYGYNSSNWHIDVCGRSRPWLIKEALVSILDGSRL